MSEQWLAVGLAILSLALAVSWRRFEPKQINDRFKRLLAVPGLKGAAIFFYFVGIPYLALILGILTPRFLGLKGLEHFVLINWSGDFLVAQIQQAITLMLLEWLLDSSVMILAGLVALLLLIAIRTNLAHNEVALGRNHDAMLYTIYYGLHWAFYRAIFWSITGDLYLGVVLGLGFVILEWSLTSWLQGKWSDYKHRFLADSIILILTSTLFFYSPNLWLLWPIHRMFVAVMNGQWGVMTLANKA